jgi:hypothetical protein
MAVPNAADRWMPGTKRLSVRIAIRLRVKKTWAVGCVEA